MDPTLKKNHFCLKTQIKIVILIKSKTCIFKPGIDIPPLVPLGTLLSDVISQGSPLNRKFNL